MTFSMLPPYLKLPKTAQPFGDAATAASDVEATIAQYGCAVTVNGIISSIAIVDEDAQSIKRAMDALPLEIAPEGYVVIFYFAPSSPDVSVDIRTIYWDGETYNAFPGRAVSATDTRVMRSVLASRQATR